MSVVEFGNRFIWGIRGRTLFLTSLLMLVSVSLFIDVGRAQGVEAVAVEKMLTSAQRAGAAAAAQNELARAYALVYISWALTATVFYLWMRRVDTMVAVLVKIAGRPCMMSLEQIRDLLNGGSPGHREVLD